MNTCKITKHFNGMTKDGAIKSMIAEKVKQKERKVLSKIIPKHVKDRVAKINEYRKEAKELREQASKIDDIRTKLQNKVIKDLDNNHPKIRFWGGSYGREIASIELNDDYCFVPDDVLNQLEKYDKYMALGKRKQANDIIDKIIKEWKLI